MKEIAHALIVALRMAVVAALYLGAGALLHAVIIGPTLAWNSAWTIGILLGWPVAIVAGIVAIALTIMIIVLACVLIAEWRERRRLRAIVPDRTRPHPRGSYRI